MIKKSIYYTSILLIVAFISSGFKPNNALISDWFRIDGNESLIYNFPSLKNNDYYAINVPFKGKFFIGFKEAVAFKESQGKYNKVNTLGYLGKYQFGMETLKTIGVNDSLYFLSNHKLQEKAFVTLLSKNKYDLKEYIERYNGKIINGVKITESGILAAAHLGGPGSVIKFLETNGQRAKKDSYGTSVRTYLRDFAGYETKGIIPVKNAKVK
ncbi:peptidoglycan-binding protein LysM [Flavobacterium sp.]|uniref:peptidoglycan-binding protein LysM n=1 Tax=Flavobacterium sp. TaxID=239 RepID=UPI0035B3D866